MYRSIVVLSIMTKQEDIWNCSECGQLYGRHDLWFEGEICEKCYAEINYAIVDYDKMQLTLWFNKEEFIFDLTNGDIGDFWDGFETSDEEVYDVNYLKEKGYDDDVEVFGTFLDEDGCFNIDTSNSYYINIKQRIGDENNYLNYRK